VRLVQRDETVVTRVLAAPDIHYKKCMHMSRSARCVDTTVCVDAADKTVKLWKVSERRKRTDGFNLRDEMGSPVDPSSVTSLRVPVFKPMELMVEASPRRVFANAHTYHINSISVNSDGATYLSADDLRINLWHMENNDQSFSIFVADTRLE